MSLYISTQRPDHSLDNSEIDKAIINLAAYIALGRAENLFPTSPHLEITFLYPGEHDQLPFRGMRMGNYTDKLDTLHFMAAVPSHITRSHHTEAYLKVLLEDVVANAEDFFEHSQKVFDSPGWHDAIKRLVP